MRAGSSHAAAAGAGIGLYDTLINAVVVQSYRERAARPMLAVHSAATIGAMLAPPLVGWIASAHHFTASFAAAGWAHVAIAVWAACVPLPAPEPRGSTPDAWSRPRPRERDAAPARRGRVRLRRRRVVGDDVRGAVCERRAGARCRARSARDRRVLARPAGRAPRGARRAQRARRADPGRRGRERGGAARRQRGPAARRPRLGFFASRRRARLRLSADDRARGPGAPSARGTAAGLAAGAGALGGVAVPWVTGAAGDAAGITLGFASLALWCAAIAAAAMWCRRVR